VVDLIVLNTAIICSLCLQLTLKLLQDAQANPEATPASHMQRSYQIQNTLLVRFLLAHSLSLSLSFSLSLSLSLSRSLSFIVTTVLISLKWVNRTMRTSKQRLNTES